MSEKRKTLLRSVCALMAGLIAVLLAHTHSFAQPDEVTLELCSPQDFTGYLSDLASDSIEGTPLEYLVFAETYLAKCSARPEAGRVALRAARNALDAGLPEKALPYYKQALNSFAAFTQQDRLDYITALVLNGQDDIAWGLLDKEIQNWLSKLDDDGLATVETIRLRDGLIYKAVFDAADPHYKDRVIWLALPFDGGFPATITHNAEDSMIALADIRYGEAAKGFQQVKLRRCHGQVTLKNALNGLSEAAAHEIAMEAAKAYLAAPDGVLKTKPGQPIATCFALDRLFIAPDPRTSEAL